MASRGVALRDRAGPGEVKIKVAAVVTGLAFAVGAICVAFYGAAAGEGWARPYHFSPILLFAYPLAFLRLTEEGDRSLIGLDVLLLVVAGVADALFVKACIDDAAGHAGPIPLALWPVLWTALWLFWQVLIVSAMASPAPEGGSRWTRWLRLR